MTCILRTQYPKADLNLQQMKIWGSRFGAQTKRDFMDYMNNKK